MTSNSSVSVISVPIIGAAVALLTAGAFADPAIAAGKPRPSTADGYYVPYVTGPDGRKHSVMNIPGSVTVISREVIDDQQATTLGDVLRNSPGVTVIGR